MHPTIHDFVGKTWAELPCWELVAAYYAAQGIALRPYTDYWMSGAPSDTGLSEWMSVHDEPREGDILAMNLTGRAADHVGIYLGGGSSCTPRSMRASAWSRWSAISGALWASIVTKEEKHDTARHRAQSF